MKLALFTDGIFPYVIGGMQKHSFYLAKYFAQNGVFVDLYHCNQSKLDINKLEFFSEEEKKYICSFILEFPKLGIGPGHYLRESYEYSKQIFNLFIKNKEVDFIYAKGFTAWYLFAEKSKGFSCAAVGINFHGYEMFQKAPDMKSWLAQRFLLQKPVLYNTKQADYVFSYGRKITEIVKEIGIDQSKIIECPTGIEDGWIVPEIKKANEKRKFIFVGRYERRKGIKELNRVIKGLLSNSNFEFDFIGDIPAKYRIASANIRYHGIVTEAEKIKAVLQSGDVLVCPSHSEGMPNVILEAMASGLAVIATDVGAVSRMVNKDTGWLLREPAVEEIQSALINAIQIPDAALDKMKKASLIKSQNFLWNKVIKSLLNSIQSRLIRSV